MSLLRLRRWEAGKEMIGVDKIDDIRRLGRGGASTRASPNSALRDSASAALSAAVRAEGSAPGSFFSMCFVNRF